MLAPAMNINYLASLSNILLHTITPVLAMADFSNSGDALKKGKASLLLPLVMPLIYSMYFFTSYSMTGKMPVPYFFLDYMRFGWFGISSSGIGVAYWMAVLTLILIWIGRTILRLRCRTLLKPCITMAVGATMISLSLATSLVSLGR